MLKPIGNWRNYNYLYNMSFTIIIHTSSEAIYHSSVRGGCVFDQVLHRYCSVEGSSYWEHVLINHKVRGVEGMHCLHARVVDPNKEERPREFLRIEGKILSAH